MRSTQAAGSWRIGLIGRGLLAAVTVLASAGTGGAARCGSGVAGTWRLDVELCTPICAPGAVAPNNPCTAEAVTFHIRQRGAGCRLLSVVAPGIGGLGRTKGESIEVAFAPQARLTASCAGERMENVVYEVHTRPPPAGGCGAIIRGPMTRVAAGQCNRAVSRRRACRTYCAAREAECEPPQEVCRRRLRDRCRADGLRACDLPIRELPPPSFPIIAGAWKFAPTSCEIQCSTIPPRPPRPFEPCDRLASHMILLQYGDDCSLLSQSPITAWRGAILEDRRTVALSLSLSAGRSLYLDGVLVDDALMTDVRERNPHHVITGCDTTRLGVMTRTAEASCHRSPFLDGPPLR